MFYPRPNRRKCYWLCRDCIKGHSQCSTKCPDYVSVAKAERARREVKLKSITEKAEEIWGDMNQNEKTGVRFGLFPLSRMENAENEGYNGKDLAVALMKEAEKDGGMRA